jgi:WD40 repeat protein
MSSTIYCGHSDNVFAVSWAPDGVSIASGSRDTTVRVWNAATGEDHYIYRGHHTCVLSVAWSPDGRYIASGDTEGIVHIWNAGAPSAENPFEEQVTLVTYRGHARFVRSIAWSPDGKYIASGGDYGDNTVQVWEASSGNHIYTHSSQYRIFAVVWSPDGRYISSGSFDGTVQVWSWNGGGESYIYHGHTGPVYAVAWIPAGTYIASAGHDATVQVWSTEHPQEPMHIYRGHTLPVKAMAWSPEGKYIASGGDDATVQVWEAITGKHIATSSEHTNWVRALAWNPVWGTGIPDGKCIASASDATVRIWEWRNH